MFFYFFLTLIALVSLFYLYGKYYERMSSNSIKNTETNQGVPHGSYFSILNFLFFGNNNILKTQMELKEKLGEIYFTFFFNIKFLNVHSPNAVKMIMTDSKTFIKQTQQKSPIIDYAKELLSPIHVVAVNGDDWKRQRESMEKGFQNLDLYTKSMMEKTKELLGILEKEGVVENILKHTQNFTLDVLGKTIFNHEFNSMKGKMNNDLKSYNKMIEVIADLKTILYLLIPFVKDKIGKELTESTEHLKKMIEGLIKESREKMQNGEVPSNILDYMVIANEDKQLSDAELISNVFVFFLAGHETTSTALSFAILLLSKKPDIQEKLRDEIKSVLKDEEANSENVKDLLYLNAFIKENLRLYSPVTVIIKEAAKDVVIDNYKVPKGTVIALPVFEIHRNTQIFPNPEEFIPERWMGEEGKKIAHYAWIPFSSGQRVCIGNNFSLMEQRLFLVELLRNFKCELVNPNDVLETTNSFLVQPIPKKIKFEKLK